MNAGARHRRFRALAFESFDGEFECYVEEDCHGVTV
jgi:hypothetical protein